MKKRMCKIMALAMTAAMVVPMAAQTTAFAADDKEIDSQKFAGNHIMLRRIQINLKFHLRRKILL